MRKRSPSEGEKERLNDVCSTAPAQPPASMHIQHYPPPVDAILRPVGFLNGQVVYMIGGPSTPDATPPQTITTKERKAEDQPARESPYVKKPPNAFMLFVREQRPKVVAEFSITNNATINTILGKRWKSLSQEEQAPYFERANMERQLHEQRHPDWSGRQNYGRRKRREPIKTAFRFTVPVIKTEEDEDEDQCQAHPTTEAHPDCPQSPPSPIAMATASPSSV